MAGSRSRNIRDKLQKALLKERFNEALTHYEALEHLEPAEPRWPHRRGDLLKRLGRSADAIRCYERAVDLYAQQGFVARAAAMAKVVIAIDPQRIDVLERVSPEAARRLHRSSRSGFVTADSDYEDWGTQPRRITADAIPLVADRSAEPDLLRFTKPPTAGSVSLELEISETEVDDRRWAGDEAEDAPTAEQLAQLPSMPLFAEVPRPILARLLRESRLVDLEPGENLIQRGTTADALYVLIEGSVQLVRPTDRDAVVLSEGDVVGISCLLDQVNYQGDVTACTKARALRISKLLLDRLVAEHPPLGDVLLEVLGRRLVATLVRTSPMFAGFHNHTRWEVAAMFEIRRADKGTILLAAGKRADGLYIPMIGQLVAIEREGKEVGHLKLGRALGQHSMLTREPSAITVKAVSDVLVLRLSARRFEELVAKHPIMVAHLEELARTPSSPGFSLIPEPQHKKGA
ncbi:MAG TPA: cyclic nucleotide-binding domain-containing protein [Polyangiales bacterium]|nr:cyclic nucleotide-binding domain-containing protein [Polyangiales bacterium]